MYRFDVVAAIVFLCRFVRVTVEYCFEHPVIQSYFTFEEESNKQFSDREKRSVRYGTLYVLNVYLENLCEQSVTSRVQSRFSVLSDTVFTRVREFYK